MKLADGDKNGLADDSSVFLGSDIPAGNIMNLRPLGEVDCVASGEFICFGVLGFGSPFVELKLSSLGPYLGKL